MDFIVPDRELAAACGSSERKLLTPRLGDVPWEIEARRESRIDRLRLGEGKIVEADE